MPDKKERGTIIKFVALARWSNFSAHRPIIIPSELKMKDPKNVNIKIIDVATTQIKFADTYEGSSGSSIERVASKMAQKIGNIIIESIYPIRILSASTTQAVLGQGGKAVKVGDIYKVYQLGEKMIDPYTKESLGREEIEVGALKILTVRRPPPTLLYFI